MEERGFRVADRSASFDALYSTVPMCALTPLSEVDKEGILGNEHHERKHDLLHMLSMRDTKELGRGREDYGDLALSARTELRRRARHKVAKEGSRRCCFEQTVFQEG